MNTIQTIVDPSKIESELIKIWDALSDKKMRACLFNLIVFSRLDARTDYIRNIVQKLIDKFPCRILFITHDTDPNKNYMKTAISVISQETESQIACEQIDVGVAGSDWERVPYLLRPHILPDLPVYLLWGEDPTENHPLFNSFAELATRIIFDSESASNMLDFASTLIDIKEKRGRDIADLNWARVEGWRDLLLSVFDTESRQKDLYDIQEIKFVYNGRETEFFCHLKIQAMYLLSLFATRLGWKKTKAKAEAAAYRFTFEQGLSAVIEPALWQNLGPGAVISIEVTTKNGSHYFFSRIPKMPHHVEILISTTQQCELPSRFVLGKTVTGQSLVKEIFLKGTSQFFLESLHQMLLLDKEKVC